MVSQAAPSTTRRTPERDIFRVAGVALTVASIEWYDFFIYGTAAALVFPKLFFPEQTPLWAHCFPSRRSVSVSLRDRSVV